MKLKNKDLKKQVNDYFVENPNTTLNELATMFNVSETFAANAIELENYNLVPSLNVENRYFLFTNFLEKIVECTSDKLVLNFTDFTSKEKMFLKNNGLNVVL